MLYLLYGLTHFFADHKFVVTCHDQYTIQT